MFQVQYFISYLYLWPISDFIWHHKIFVSKTCKQLIHMVTRLLPRLKISIIIVNLFESIIKWLNFITFITGYCEEPRELFWESHELQEESRCLPRLVGRDATKVTRCPRFSWQQGWCQFQDQQNCCKWLELFSDNE